MDSAGGRHDWQSGLRRRVGSGGGVGKTKNACLQSGAFEQCFYFTILDSGRQIRLKNQAYGDGAGALLRNDLSHRHHAVTWIEVLPRRPTMASFVQTTS